MKNLFVFILLTLFSVTANAATLEWTVNTSAGSVTYTAPAVSDANMDRFIDFLWGNYAPTDPTTGETLPRTAGNEATAFRAWAAANWNGVKRNVLEYERQNNADVARNAVPEFTE